jgi:hypothetical protein
MFQTGYVRQSKIRSFLFDFLIPVINIEYRERAIPMNKNKRRKTRKVTEQDFVSNPSTTTDKVNRAAIEAREMMGNLLLALEDPIRDFLQHRKTLLRALAHGKGKTGERRIDEYFQKMGDAMSKIECGVEDIGVQHIVRKHLLLLQIQN